MSRFCALFVFLSAFAVAQTPDTATINGHVTDQSHAGVAGVQVAVKNTQSGLERKAETSASGDFTIVGLPVAGAYDITAVKQGFADGVLSHVVLQGGTTADLTVQLNVGAGQTQLTVTGVAGEVRTDEPQLGVVLNTMQIEETPLLDRKITYLPLLNAANRQAINQGDVFMNENMFTTNGTGRRQAWFEVDGSNAVDMWGRQTIFSNMPAASLQEMTVLTNAFSAEYGGTAGSVINMVSKSGGSQFHGEAYYAARPSGTEAALAGFTATNATSGNDLTNDTMNQMALSMGGPLGSDHKTHIFGAGEYHHRKPCFSDHFAGRAGQLRGTLSRLAGLFPAGSPTQRQPHPVLPQRRGWLPRHQPQRHRGRQQPAHRGAHLPAPDLFGGTGRDRGVEPDADQ